MSENTIDNRTAKSFKLIIILLAFTVLGSLFYIFKVSDRSKNVILSLREEKSIVLKDLEKSNMFLQQIKTTNNDLSEKLELEQQKVAKLIAELKTGNINEGNIAGYKQNASNLDNRIKLLLNEINVYKKRIDSTNAVLNTTNVILYNTNNILKNEKSKNDSLTFKNKSLNTIVVDASKLYYYNIQTNFFKLKSSGSQVETSKTSKINIIKTSFMIGENKIAKPFNSEYYIQIIDSKNNIVGEKKERSFGDNVLIYCGAVQVKYDNKTIKAEIDIPVKDLESGFYFLNIFDKSKIILKSTFELK